MEELQQNLYGLIGFPLSHSYSKKYFTEKFLKNGIINCSYELFPLENIEQLPVLISNNSNLRGLNVTVPYKETVIPFLDEIDKTAELIGAVNCIKITQDQSESPKLKGYNTDVDGFRQSIKPFLEAHHERALILGTGGASKAIHFVLNEIGVECYFVSRNKTNNKNHLTYEELNKHVFDSCKLVINATPVGMFPNTDEHPEIPYKLLGSKHLLYDLIYNPAETEFIRLGKQNGASTLNGLSMLHLQAEEAWRLWR